MGRRAIKKVDIESPSYLDTFIEDSIALYNPLQNYGGKGDPSRVFSFYYQNNNCLEDYLNLYKSSALARRIVDCLPSDALISFTGFDSSRDGISDPSPAYQWFKDKAEILFKLLQAARLLGNSYLVISRKGEREGDLKKPLKLGVKAADLELHIYNSDTCTEKEELRTIFESYYDVCASFGGAKVTVHGERVLHLTGVKYPLQCLGGSVLSGDLTDKLVSYEMSLKAASSLLQRHSVFMFKVDNLAQKAINKKLQEGLEARFNLMNQGLSINNSYVLDTKEDGQFISQTYGGFVDVMEKLELALVAVTGMPAHKLLGTAKGGAFSESGESDRYYWASEVAAYCSAELTPVIKWILKVLGTTKEYQGVDNLNPVFSRFLPETDLELAKKINLNADTDSKYVALGSYSPEEVRASRFSGYEYGDRIILDS